jgi:hypothetical protein
VAYGGADTPAQEDNEKAHLSPSGFRAGGKPRHNPTAPTHDPIMRFKAAVGVISSQI